MTGNPRSLTVISAAAITDSGEQWIDVIPTVDKARNGRFYFTVTRDDLDIFAASIAAQAGLVPVDYDHEGAVGGSTVAAGWFTGETRIVAAGEVNPAGETQDHTSLWAVVKWTPQAAQEIRDGRFKRISAENSFAEKDPKTGLLTKAKEFIAATLTNRPFFKELAPLAAEDQGRLAAAFDEISASSLDAFDEETRERVLAWAKTIGGEAAPTEGASMHESLKAIAAELNLAEDATDEQVLEAVKARKQEPAPEPREDEVVLSKEQVDTLTANAAAGLAAKTELDALKVSTKLDAAVRAGKLTPAQRPSFEALAAVDFDAFAKAVDELPEGAFKMRATGTGSGDPAAGGDDVPAPAPIRSAGTLTPVDEDTFAVHATAAKTIAEDGKRVTSLSQAELIDRYEAAGYDGTVDMSRIERVA